MKTKSVVMMGGISLAAVTALLLFAALSLPVYGNPTLDAANYMLKVAVDKTGAANIVCSIVLDIRGYDTLGEATLLLAAVTGVVLVLGKKQ